MSCILKFPDDISKGVVVFTTPERDDLILKSAATVNKIEQLKDRWIIGLHHNWHDHRFVYNPLFDFSMAGEEDLREVNNRPVPLVPMDACNFSPSVFSPAENKFWDILYVARAVNFKKIPEFLKLIKQLYSEKKYYRVAFLCPVPQTVNHNDEEYNIRAECEKVFTEDEFKYFNLFAFEYGYPFPLDMEALSFFYKSSRIFVHTANDERRCRVAAYAWSTGLPVVAMDCVGSLLPPSLRKEPYFFSVPDYSKFSVTVERALESITNKNSFSPVIELFKPEISSKKLLHYLHEKFNASLDCSGYFLADLDIRLGRHYGLSTGANRIGNNFEGFIKYLQCFETNMPKNFARTDPEKQIASEIEPAADKISLSKTFLHRYRMFKPLSKSK